MKVNNSFLAHIPDAGEPIPQALTKAANGPVRLVWKNGVGGLTATTVGVPGRNNIDEPGLFLKWNPLPSSESLADEGWKLRWIAGRHPAPIPVDLIQKRRYEILSTEALPGLSAVDPHWTKQPNIAIAAIADGLRRLHELPVDDCPYSWSVESRIGGKDWPSADIDRLVVCHGDPCAPNTLLDDEGNFLAHVDIGRLGVADRWADLAVATMSFDWNFVDYDQNLFWEIYGVEPDWPRIQYYRDLWNAT